MSPQPSRAWSLQAVVLLTVAGVACWQSRVQAYVDPGSGSMVIQLMLGGVAGVAVAVRVYWRRLTARIHSKPPDPSGPPKA